VTKRWKGEDKGRIKRESDKERDRGSEKEEKSSLNRQLRI